MTEDNVSKSPRKQSDLMLGIAAAAVVGLGAIWLVLSAPWWSGEPATGAAPAGSAASVQQIALTTRTGTPARRAPRADTERASLDNPLRLAELAYEAGMLVEPEEYSAWGLYVRALELDESSDAARQGLSRVADDLLARSAVAIEQGRYADARATALRILGALPDHAAAKALVERIEAAEAPEPVLATARVRPPAPEAPASSAPEPAVRPARVEREPARAPAPPPTDRIKDLAESFNRALAANELLTPPDRSARHYVEEMLAADAADPRTVDLRDLLVTELLSRSNQALEALDLEAARTWVDEAEGIADDPEAIAAQRARLTESLVAMESAKPVSASDLTIVDYVAPEYPRMAISRGIEGWVDVEFIVTIDGKTRDVNVADASHDRFFHDEAVEAVSAWRFEPRVFMERNIEQRSYTRVRFELGD